MPPNNTTENQSQYGTTSPVSPVSQPVLPPAPNPAQPTATNYAAAVFFTLLIVGFTFHLPLMLYVPVMFFCIIAGVLFFRDSLSSKPGPQPIPGHPGLYYAPEGIKKKRNPLMTLLIAIFAVMGFMVLIYVGFIALILISLGSSGV